MMSTALLLIHASHWLAATLLLGIGVYSLRFRRRPVVLALASFCFLASIWALAAAVIFMTPDLESKIALNRIKLVAPVVLPPCILVMTMAIRGYRRWYPYAFLIFALVPAAGLLMLASHEHHHLLIGNYGVISIAGHELLTFANGPWFFYHNANARFVALTSIGLLASAAGNLSSTHRYRVWLVVLAISIPFIGDTVAVHIAPVLRYMQATPTLLLISAVLFIYAAAQNHMVDVVPFARTQILDSLGDIYLVFNDRHELVDFNAKACKVLALSRRSIGRCQGDLIQHDGRLAELLALGASESKEWNFSQATYEVSRHNLGQEESNRLGFVIACKDVSLRKKEEQALRDLNDVKTKLLAVVGHDFQGNLAAALVIAQNLAANLPSMQAADVTAACYHLEKILLENATQINDLLQWAKQTLGVVPPQQAMDLQTIAERLQGFALPLARERQVSTDFEIEATPYVVIDSTAVLVILRNLVVNAIKASAPYSRISVKLTTMEAQLAIQVKDSGPGISQERQADLFCLKKQGSSGIGLYLCHEFVIKLGGQIWCESQLGSGATFHVTLPIVAPAGDNDAHGLCGNIL